MAGCRTGYAAVPLNVIKVMTSFRSHATSNANSIAQYAAAVALTNGEEWMENMVAEFDKRRRMMHSLIMDIPGLSAHLPEGAFYMMLNISGVIGKKHNGEPIENSMDFARLLLTAQKVAVVPGTGFGAPNFVRWSYATSIENIKEGLNRLEKFLKGETV